MQILPILFALSLALAHSAIAQKSKFLPGYLVTIDGDTLRGLIQDLPSTGNYDSCLFKTQANSNPLTYHPAKLKAYQIDNRKSMASRRIQYKEQPREVYLEVLANGKATLFRYKRYDESYYLVEKTGSDIQPLTSNTVKKDGVYLRDNKFRVALTKLFADCSSTDLSELNDALLQEKNLTKLVAKYNQCDGAPRKKEPSSVFNFGILGGINSSTYSAPSLSFSTSKGFYGPYNATTFQVGAFLELTNSTGRGSSFRADLVYFSPHYIGSETQSTTHYESTLDVEQLKLPVAYKYTFLNKKLSPYFILGATFAYTISVQRQLTISSTTGGFPDEHYLDTVPMDDHFGYFGGLGAMISLSQNSKVFLEVRAEKATNTSSLVALTGLRF